MTSEYRLSKAPSSHLARFISPVFELQELISQLLLPSELPFALEVVLHLGVEPSTTTQLPQRKTTPNYLTGLRGRRYDANIKFFSFSRN